MTEGDALRAVVAHWMRKAEEALASADSELSAGRYEFAVNRAYYACFYAASAVLLQTGKRFVKHSGLRSAFHEHLVKRGKLDAESGRTFDRLAEARLKADYTTLFELEQDRARALVSDAQGLVRTLRHVLEDRQ